MKAVSQYPLEAKTGLAWTYYKKGEKTPAKRLFNQLLVQNPLDENIQLGVQLTSANGMSSLTDVYYTNIKYDNSPYKESGYAITISPGFTHKIRI